MGEEKGRSFRMCLNLNEYQFKTSKYCYRSTYMNPMVTTDQKPTIDTKTERKKHKHTTKENHQTIRAEAKRRKEQKELQKQPENK